MPDISSKRPKPKFLKILAFIVFAAASLVFYNAKSKKQSQPQAPVIFQPLKEPKDDFSVQKFNKRKTRVSEIKTQKTREIKNSEPNILGIVRSDPDIVEFLVKDGMAIVFGDILLGKISDKKMKKGKARLPKANRWDNPIAFHIEKDLVNPDRVMKALKYFNNYTNVKFVPYESYSIITNAPLPEDILVFIPGESNCYSYLGRVGGHQPIVLADQCTWSAVLHEVMHALGFIHEQSRTDRDRYVEILWKNIKDGYEGQFAMVPEEWMDPVRGTLFDFSSVMIYDIRAFSIDKRKTTLKPLGSEIINPSKVGLSQGDIKRINTLY
jgi:hypothetical protein